MKAKAVRRGRSKATPHDVRPEVHKADQPLSRALEKGLQAIDSLSQAADGLSLSDTAVKLGLSKASAFRIIRTLESLGYLTKAPDGKYSVAGGPARHLSSRSVQKLIHIGTESLHQLVTEFRETATLAALFDNHMEVVAVVESPEPIRMTNTLGRILPPHGSSLGKSMVSFLDANTREHLLRSYGTATLTPHTITDPHALSREYEQVRSRGYAEDWEESTPGGVCFGAPVLRPGDVAVGAISVSLPKMRLDGEDKQMRIVKAVRQAAVEISRKLFGAAAGV